jgi:hypothetical protein
MHTKSVFNELGHVRKLTTSTRTSRKETPIKNKKREKQNMQMIELPKMM